MTAPAAKKQTIAYYKTNVGIFIQKLNCGAYYNPYPFTAFKFNGIQGHGELTNGYLHLQAESSLHTVERWVSPVQVQTGYKLRADVPEAVAATLPAFFSLPTVERVWGLEDDDYSFGNKEFQAIKSLYTEAYETTEGSWEAVEFEPVILGDIVVENYNQPEKMVVRYQSEGAWGSGKIAEADLSTVVSYADIEKLLTPEFMLHTRPCKLTSDQVYKLVRAYVKENINPRAAEITSDYDFCFTVKRKIHHKPVTTRTETKKANGRSYASPKFNSRTVSYRSEEIFEMTSASKHYNNYTIIQGWEANSLVDMQNQVKYYLDTLMQEINKEVEVCSCCNGVGSVITKIATNAR